MTSLDIFGFKYTMGLIHESRISGSPPPSMI